MCDMGNGHHIAASRYLSAAKKKNKELKKLKSVSRAYRKSQVRGLKTDAAREQALHEAEMQSIRDKANAQQERHRELFLDEAARGSTDYYNTGFSVKNLLSLYR